MKKTKKRIGILGCGYWGKNLIRNFADLGVLQAIGDIDRDKLKSFGERYAGVATHDSPGGLISDPGIDAVVVATPAETHFDLAFQALSAGKDVFVEKPLSLTYRDAEKLVALAEERSLVLMVGHILEYHPAIVRLKELIDQGMLGKINYIYSNRLNLGKFRTEENILWSFAPHDISVILTLLGEMPVEVFAQGGNYINPDVADVTVTTMKFPEGVNAHIYVNWLHPYKEQKLVVIGDRNMVVFDDVKPENKLIAYKHKIDWIERIPVPKPEAAEPIAIEMAEPLKLECAHFLDCLQSRKKPKTDGRNGLRVLKVLETCQRSLREGIKISLAGNPSAKPYYVHESSFVDEGVEIGPGTKVWHFCHVLRNTKIGKDCILGQNVMVGPNVTVGNNVKIQNNVSVYDGVTLEDDVFCSPSMVFTNVVNPRSHWPRKDEFKKTLVKRGATLGANCTVVCGHTIGSYAFVGAGAVVSRDVPDHAIVHGVPARIRGWMCHCGVRLEMSDSPASKEKASCSGCGACYAKEGIEVRRTDES